jgi:hypothetical protein
MAEVDVIAPNGELGSIPEEQLEAAKAQGYRVPGGAAPVSDEVDVRAPDGSVGTVPRSQLKDALDQGYSDLAQERFQTLGQKAATVGEGLARGASMGVSDVVQTAGAGIGTGIGNKVADWLLGETPRAAAPGIDAPLAEDRPLYDSAAAQAAGADIAARKEANSGLALGSEIVGAVAPAVLSGGVGSAAAAAKLTPAGQMANLATKLSGMLGKQMGGTAVGRITALGITGAVEGAVDQATRRVMEDLATGNADITAERMIDAAWDSAKWGGLVGGAAGAGAGLLSEAAQGVVRGGKALADTVAAKVGGMDEQAGMAAFRALGRADNRVANSAARAGGEAAIGDTLLRKGIVQAGDTAEMVAERVAPALDDAGKQLGSLLDEVGDATTSRKAVWDRIEEEVLKPQARPGAQDIADGIRAKLKASGIEDVLNASQVTKRGGEVVDRQIGLKELHEIRKTIDQRPDLKWLHAGPGPVDPATEAMRDVRRVIEDAFEQASDEAAKTRGVDDYLTRLKAGKREYQQLAVANQLANKEAIRQARNNRLGLPDLLAGVAGAASMGPLGAAGALAYRYGRDRAEATVAATLYKLGRGAISQESRVAQAIESTLKSATQKVVTRGAAPLSSLGASAADNTNYTKLVAQAQELQDPESPASQQLDAMTLQLAGESPELADAIRQKVMKKAEMVVQKLGPSTDPSDPLKRQKMLVDPVTKSRNERFLRAVTNPAEALDRLASGRGSAEDLAVVRELTPLVHKRYVDGVMERLVGGKQKLTNAQKQRLLFAMGTPVTREQTPEYQRFFTGLMHGRGGQEGQPSEGGGLPAERQAQGSTKDFKVDTAHWASRADSLMGGADE